MARKFKTVIPTKQTTTSCRKQLKTKKTTKYEIGKPNPDLGETQKWSKVKFV